MDQLQLSFDTGDTSLSVRSFAVSERVNELYTIQLVARAPSADIDFEALIGQQATFSLNTGTLLALGALRSWTGICNRCEQVRAEPNGLSSYQLTIVPKLWLLTQRRNYRLFQHVSVVDILTTLLREWGLEHELKLDETHPPLELRAQYGESDYNFLARLLQEAGISYSFQQQAERGSVLIFSDQPHAAELRAQGLPFVDAPEQAQAADVEYCTAVRVRRDMRPAKVVLRDFDFRKPRYELFADARADAGPEAQLEQYHYVPGSFKTEGHELSDTPTADDLGVARADQRAGTSLATRILDGERSRRRTVAFRTNAFDVAPGMLLCISGHPRAELHAAAKLLIVGATFVGEVGKEWTATAESVFADVPYRPALQSVKPRINGVQSAIVVGPSEETVYTDEFGRVRVQFHWDRQGSFDPHSSAWMRVSQGWAGPGYGLFNLPRVGHEVLVGFIDGDPDQPIVVGRVFNGAQQVPYPLPGSKMMSGWKTDSNSNIILFDDSPGDELFYEQAERNRLGIVKRHEAYITGGRRTEWIGTTEKTLIRTSATRVTGGSHTILAGITAKSVGTVSWKAQAGFGAEIKAGCKFEASVTPVLPFITAMMAVDDAKLSIYSKLPGGKAPDLQQLLPYYAGGPQPTQPKLVTPPNLSQDEVEEELKKILAVVGNAVTQFEPEEVEAMAEASDLDQAITQMLTALHKKGGDEAVSALADAQALAKQLKLLAEATEANQALANQSPQQANQSPQQATSQQQDKPTSLFEKLIIAILGMILPKTKITIKHQKIKLETEKASIEIDKGDIKLSAKGDIEIKADGNVSITGAAVRIDPKPC